MACRPDLPKLRVILAGLSLSLVLFVPARLSRAAPRIVEFQLKPSKLFDLIQHRLLEEDVCVLGPFPHPLNPGLTVVLDHLSFPGGMELQRTDQQVQVVVPVEVFTKIPDCIEDPNCAPDEYQPAAPVAIGLVFDLTVDGAKVCVEFSGLQFAGQSLPLEFLPPAMAAGIQNFLAPICTVIDLSGPLQTLLGAPPEVKQTGLSADNALTRIAVRIEYKNPEAPNQPPDPSWAGFAAGQVAPQPPEAFKTDWSVFVDEGLFRRAVAGRFTGTSDLEIDSGPTATWEPAAANGGRVTVTFSGEVDAVAICPTFAVDAVVPMDFFVEGSNPNVIKSHGTLDIDVDDGDVLFCSLIVGGPAGPHISSLVLTIMAVVAANAGPGSGDLPDECAMPNDEEFSCSFPVTLPSINLSKWGTVAGVLTLDRLYGLPEGPVLGGPVYVPPLPEKKLLSVDPIIDFDYGVRGKCHSFAFGWVGGAKLSGNGRLCGPIEVIDDPLGVFAVTWTGNHWLGSDYLGVPGQWADFVFPTDESKRDAYFADPYPLRFVIRSSVGSRAIEVPPPSAPPAEGTAEWFQLQNDMIEAKASCLKLMAFIPGVFNPIWHVDPPPWDVPVNVLFDDPFTPDEGVSAVLTELAVTSDDVLVASADETGGLRFEGVGLTLHAELLVDAGAAGLSAAAAKETDSDVFPVTVDEPLQADLSAKLLEEDRAELSFTAEISRIIEIPSEQLPAGIQAGSFQLTLKPDQMSLATTLRQTDDDGDGDPDGSDCAPQDPGIHAGADEICNDGVDNDCDQLVDCEDENCGEDPGCAPASVGPTASPEPSATPPGGPGIIGLPLPPVCGPCGTVNGLTLMLGLLGLAGIRRRPRG